MLKSADTDYWAGVLHVLDFFKDDYAFYIVNLFAGGEAFGWIRDFQGESGAIACLFVSGDDI